MYFPLENIRKTAVGKWKMHHFTGAKSERIDIPATADADGYYSVTLIEVPDAGTATGTTTPPKIDGFTEFRGEPFDPNTNLPNFKQNQFWVNYQTGALLFHQFNAGVTIYCDYWGRGSLVEAEDVNDLNERLKKIEVFQDAPSFTKFEITNQPIEIEIGGTYPVNQNTKGEYTVKFYWETEFPENILNNSINIWDVNNNTLLGQNLPNTGLYEFVFASVVKFGAPKDLIFKIEGMSSNRNYFSKTIKVSWKYRIYWGTIGSTSFTSSMLSSLKTKLVSCPHGDYEFDADGYFVLVIPQNLPKIKRIVDKDFSLPIVFGTKLSPINILNEYNIGVLHDVYISENMIHSNVVAEVK